MKEKFLADIYDTLQGVMQQGFGYPNVENLFAEGSLCAQQYSNMLEAYERLCNRLGVVDEDGDVEVIISSLMTIQRELGYKMFEYGVRFAREWR